jgi:hypothetical protein
MFGVEVAAWSLENLEFVSPEPACLGLERIYGGHVPRQGRLGGHSRDRADIARRAYWQLHAERCREPPGELSRGRRRRVEGQRTRRGSGGCPWCVLETAHNLYNTVIFAEVSLTYSCSVNYGTVAKLMIGPPHTFPRFLSIHGHFHMLHGKQTHSGSRQQGNKNSQLDGCSVVLSTGILAHPWSHRRRLQRPALRFAATPPNRFSLSGFFVFKGFPFESRHASLRDKRRPDVDTFLGAEASSFISPVCRDNLIK